MKTSEKIQVIKESLKYIDLYGTEIIFLMLKDAFRAVSLCEKSIPTPGSRTYTTNNMKIERFKDVVIQKTIFHKNGYISIKTEKHGYLQFIN